eukprot:9474034-Pyramimonas_sp.AAC.2
MELSSARPVRGPTAPSRRILTGGAGSASGSSARHSSAGSSARHCSAGRAAVSLLGSLKCALSPAAVSLSGIGGLHSSVTCVS